MRVTHVITRLIVGGAQENTIASVLGLRQKPGLDVSLACGPSTGPEGSLADMVAREAFGASGAQSEARSRTLDARPSTLCSPPLLTIVPELVRPVHPLKDWLALRGLTKLFGVQRPDLVHTHSGKAGVLGRLAASRAGVPIIVHTIHGPSFGPFQGAFANFIFRAAERRVSRLTTHFVVVAEAMKTQYLAAGIGRPEQYTKIFSGFNLEPYLEAKNDAQLRARWGISPQDFVIGKIARLFKLKGHDDLFAVAPELVRRCPQMKFLLVGDGQWRSRFEQRARTAGLEKHFIFTGLVQPHEVPALVGLMDVLVHLSRREGLPRALPQALAAARPVVAYDCDGAREICFDKETGFLLQPGDLAGLTDRLLRLAGDTTLRARLGQRGQRFVGEHFGVERLVDSLYHLYMQLASDHGIRRS